ncbi:hypothetical protein [Parasphaerochaeta coccoides]|uniref:Uncharacterized protein n=1 Tax=Parasphaerochaeta coccoides (strain ATCC BAA-1237 / DSM 17374 / SPN1) TaxID=760011 RepID=F4GIC8_PARC1|nr:hypothetical protein [Parasphaerochaeta coccoides]AEC01636.1 hypothetical protein Spico_0407 [Parasphaerochaeta coccoides DSM 17374]
MTRQRMTIILFLLVLLTSPVSITASFSSLDSSAGASIDLEAQTFILYVEPNFSVGKLDVSLALSLRFLYTKEPFSLAFDPSNWLPPPREENTNNLTYILTTAEHYTSFVRYVVWGNQADPFYFRWGKLNGVFMGDGLILNFFYDTSVYFNETRPGINTLLSYQNSDNMNISLHVVTDNVFYPSLFASRIGIRPAGNAGKQGKLVVGASFAQDTGYRKEKNDAAQPMPESRVKPEMWMTAFDIGYTVIDHKFFSWELFTDVAIQASWHNMETSTTAFRLGFGGNLLTFLQYNMAATFPLSGEKFIPAYFKTGFHDLEERRTLNLGDLFLEARIGLSAFDGGIYLGASATSFLVNELWVDQTFEATVRMDFDLLKLIGLELTFSKTSESMFTTPLPDFSSPENAKISGAAFVKMGALAFDIGMTLPFNEKEWSINKNSVLVDVAVHLAL